MMLYVYELFSWSNPSKALINTTLNYKELIGYIS
jgi:hypothetical protein